MDAETELPPEPAIEADTPEPQEEPAEQPPTPASEELVSAEDPGWQSEQDPQQGEHPANSDSHEPERQ